jgi:prepilin-type N-terminal cleavage/methylation domain-containing protein
MNPHSQQQVSDQSSQAGFTIVESLVAIILVSILLAAISPVLVMATANRVQAKRVELATNAAKAYIDRIRAGAYNPSSSPPENEQIQGIIDDRRLNQVNAPVASGNLTCIANDYCSQPSTGNYLLYCVDGEGDGVCTKNSMKDMIIQVSAYQPNPSSPPSLDLGYEVGIRVYRADGFADIGSLKKSNPQTKATARTYTGGMGDRKAPQIEMQTEIVSNSTQYSDYCTRIGGCS